MATAPFVHDLIMQELRVRMALLAEAEYHVFPAEKAALTWEHVTTAKFLLDQSREMCKQVGIDQQMVDEGFGDEEETSLILNAAEADLLKTLIEFHSDDEEGNYDREVYEGLVEKLS